MQLEQRLGEAEMALLRAQGEIDLARQGHEDEKKYREFYQWLATERLQQLILLEGMLGNDKQRTAREAARPLWF